MQRTSNLPSSSKTQIDRQSISKSHQLEEKLTALQRQRNSLIVYRTRLIQQQQETSSSRKKRLIAPTLIGIKREIDIIDLKIKHLKTRIDGENEKEKLFIRLQKVREREASRMELGPTIIDGEPIDYLSIKIRQLSKVKMQLRNELKSLCNRLREKNEKQKLVQSWPIDPPTLRKRQISEKLLIDQITNITKNIYLIKRKMIGNETESRLARESREHQWRLEHFLRNSNQENVNLQNRLQAATSQNDIDDRYLIGGDLSFYS